MSLIEIGPKFGNASDTINSVTDEWIISESLSTQNKEVLLLLVYFQSPVTYFDSVIFY